MYNIGAVFSDLFGGRGGGRVDGGFLWVSGAELGNKVCKVVI